MGDVAVPISFNSDLLNDGVIFAKYNKVINVAIQGSFNFAFGRRENTEIVFLAGTMCDDGRYARLGCGHQKKEMKGFDLEEDLIFCLKNEDDEQDV